MASAGTVNVFLGTPSSLRIDSFRVQTLEGRPRALVFAQARIKSTANIDAGDLGLRTIHAAQATLMHSAVVGGIVQLEGSVFASGSLLNTLNLRTSKGTITPHTGTQHYGTRGGGTQKVSLFILGG